MVVSVVVVSVVVCGCVSVVVVSVVVCGCVSGMCGVCGDDVCV